MGWYTKVYNLTKGTYSTHDYKYGKEQLQRILKFEPGWESDDTIIGGGQYGFHFISGGHGKIINNIYDDELMEMGMDIVIDYEIIDNPFIAGS